MILVSVKNKETQEIITSFYSPSVPESWEVLVISKGRIKRKPLIIKCKVDTRQWVIHDSGASQVQVSCILACDVLEEKIKKEESQDVKKEEPSEEKEDLQVKQEVLA